MYKNENIKTLNLKPLPGHIIIDPEEGIKQLKSGILIANDRDLPTTGTVLFVGNDVHDIHVGDRVLFRKYNGKHYGSNNTEQHVISIPIDVVYAVIDRDAKIEVIRDMV